MTPAGSQTPVSPADASISSIIGSLAHFARSRPDSPAYVDARGTVAYGALYEAARRGAAWLHLQGVRAGDTVALPLDTTPGQGRPALEMFYAVVHTGAVVLPLYPDVPLENRIALIERFAARWLIASGAPQVAGASVLDPESFDAADPRYDALPAPRGDWPEAPVLYLFTSGTTGTSKVLLPTNQQLYGNLLASTLAIGTDASDRLLSAVNWPSGIGLRYLLRAYVVGAAFVAAPLGETREALGATLARFGATRISISPWQVRRLLQGAPSPQPLPPLRSMHVIGSFISPEELAQARAHLTPNACVGYGCNEIGAATLLGPGPAMPGPGWVGPLVPGMEARADGPDGMPLAPGEIGDLGFRAAWMCTGYAGNPQATRERFRDGWFYPGDAGSIDAQGNVYLRGRTQEVINYGGLKIWPDDIEAVLKQHPDILDAALAGLPDAQAGELPAAFLVPRAPLTGPLGAGLAEAALQEFCRTRVDATRVPQLFVAVAEIPRNESGKVMRDALIEAYLQAHTALTGRPG